MMGTFFMKAYKKQTYLKASVNFFPHYSSETLRDLSLLSPVEFVTFHAYFYQLMKYTALLMKGFPCFSIEFPKWCFSGSHSSGSVTSSRPGSEGFVIYQPFLKHRICGWHSSRCTDPLWGTLTPKYSPETFPPNLLIKFTSKSLKQ